MRLSPFRGQPSGGEVTVPPAPLLTLPGIVHCGWSLGWAGRASAHNAVQAWSVQKGWGGAMRVMTKVVLYIRAHMFYS